jgi:hypothetical protein
MRKLLLLGLVCTLCFSVSKAQPAQPELLWKFKTDG